jgi:hypothetical protein
MILLGPRPVLVTECNIKTSNSRCRLSAYAGTQRSGTLSQQAVWSNLSLKPLILNGETQVVQNLISENDEEHLMPGMEVIPMM